MQVSRFFLKAGINLLGNHMRKKERKNKIFINILFDNMYQVTYIHYDEKGIYVPNLLMMSRTCK